MSNLQYAHASVALFIRLESDQSSMRSIIKKIFDVFSHILVQISKALPAYVVVRAKESINKTGKLDYKGATLLMQLDSVQQLIRLNACRKEPETVGWLQNQLKLGDVFYDIGANVGAYSLVACAQTAGSCTVYAFEPSYSTFAALCTNIKLNHFEEKITPFHILLGEQTQVVNFNYASVEPGAAEHPITLLDSIPSSQYYSQLTMCFRLDDLVTQFKIRRPNHIKLDVDGHELNVLRGSPNILADSSLRSLLIEVNADAQSAVEIEQMLAEYGFSVFAKYPRGHHGLVNVVFTRSSC